MLIILESPVLKEIGKLNGDLIFTKQIKYIKRFARIIQVKFDEKPQSGLYFLHPNYLVLQGGHFFEGYGGRCFLKTCLKKA